MLIMIAITCILESFLMEEEIKCFQTSPINGTINVVTINFNQFKKKTLLRIPKFSVKENELMSTITFINIMLFVSTQMFPA